MTVNKLIDAVAKINEDLTTYENGGVITHYSFPENKMIVSEESLIKFVEMHDLDILSSPEDNPVIQSYGIEGYCKCVDDKICFSVRSIADKCWMNRCGFMIDSKKDDIPHNIPHKGIDTDTRRTAFMAVKSSEQYDCHDIFTKKITPTWTIYLRDWFDEYNKDKWN